MSAERKWLWRAVQLVLLAAVLFGMYRVLAPDLRTLTWSDITAYSPNIPRLIASLAVLLAVYLMHAFLWRGIVRDMGIGHPDARTTLRVYFVASLGRYLPGKLWQLAGFAVLAGKAGLSPLGATAAAILGQFGFLATGLLFVAVVLPDWISGGAARLLGILLVGTAGSIWLLTATPVGRRGREWIRSKLGGRMGERIGAAFDLADRIRGRDAIRWGVGYGLSWVLLGLAFSLFVTSFVPSAIAETQRLAGTLAASYLFGILVVVAPAALGVREGAMAGLLGTIPGFPMGAAVLVAILSRVWFTVGELLPLLLVPIMPATPPSPVTGAAADSSASAS